MNSYGSLRFGCFQFLFGIFLCLNKLIASTRPTLGII